MTPSKGSSKTLKRRAARYAAPNLNSSSIDAHKKSRGEPEKKWASCCSTGKTKGTATIPAKKKKEGRMKKSGKAAARRAKPKARQPYRPKNNKKYSAWARGRTGLPRAKTPATRGRGVCRRARRLQSPGHV